MHSAFTSSQYLLKRQVFALTGKFHIYDPSGQLVLFSQQKMFKLREDFRVFSDDSQSQELLRIQARQIMDFSAAYDVYDQTMGGIKVGTLRRRGWKSIARDSWHVLDAADCEIGELVEDNMTLALVRRFIAGNFLPQNYDVLINGTRAADIKQRFNLFRYELDLDFSMDSAGLLDRRLGLAAGILLAAIEGRQDS